MNSIYLALLSLVAFVAADSEFYRLYPCSSAGCPSEIPSAFKDRLFENQSKGFEKSADSVSVVNTSICVGQGTPFSIVTSPTVVWPGLTNPCPSGQYLADINAANWNVAQQVAFACGGSNRFYWVNSWNTDTYCNAPLVLVTGSVSGFGTLVSTVSPNYYYGYMCQNTPNLPNALCPTTTTTSSSTSTSTSTSTSNLLSATDASYTVSSSL